MSQAGQRKRIPRTAEVVRATWLTPSMRRVVFTGPDLRCLQQMPCTDHYLKILFAPQGCDYRWPFDPDGIKASEPAHRWPVTRTYTVRSYDADRNEMAVDFVVHGDEGLAGPWAARAVPGDRIGFFGPGGGYAPDPAADCHLLVGDESAIPAIAAALDRLGDTARASVFLEVSGPDDELVLSASPDVHVTWVHRAGRPYGDALAETVRCAGVPAGDVQAFVHGNAEMIRQLRRHLFTELDFNRQRVSMSGYWRTGQTEDGWQAGKRDFTAQLEAEDTRVAAA
ncbi:MAG: Iron utilization protein [uncultured Friedmanniella sp.]|uniref:Iron utilization protein n=1 Tax=uncultured Friedmanniella sp. TaxID=335381 RepID=A0A6J4K9Y9_9ACTN|nr:MAG: Iron utilization protein [uncultured Friedmanniella sp.]